MLNDNNCWVVYILKTFTCKQILRKQLVIYMLNEYSDLAGFKKT